MALQRLPGGGYTATMTYPVAPPPAGGMATAQPFRPVLPIVVGILLVMLIVVSVFFNKFYTGWRIHHKYQETRCTLLDMQQHSYTDSEGMPQNELDFQFEHSIAGRRYYASGFDGLGTGLNQVAAEATMARYAIGEHYPCWYDPSTPSKAVLAKPPYIVFLIFPAVFLLAFLAMVAFLWSLDKKPTAPPP